VIVIVFDFSLRQLPKQTWTIAAVRRRRALNNKKSTPAFGKREKPNKKHVRSPQEFKAFWIEYRSESRTVSGKNVLPSQSACAESRYVATFAALPDWRISSQAWARTSDDPTYTGKNQVFLSIKCIRYTLKMFYVVTEALFGIINHKKRFWFFVLLFLLNLSFLLLLRSFVKSGLILITLKIRKSLKITICQ